MEKAAGPLVVVPEMVKVAGGVNIITDLVNPTVVGLFQLNENLALLKTVIREMEIF